MNQKALLNGKAPLVPLHETKLCLVYDREEAENAKKSFRIREAMLRVLYNHLFGKGREKSITDELDEQFEKIKRGIFEFNIGTAGSISLLLQAITLPALFAPGKVTFKIKGGTCGKWQASVDYVQNILYPYLQRFVEKIEMRIIKRGYYPQGGGEVVVEITPRFRLDEYGSYTAL